MAKKKPVSDTSRHMRIRDKNPLWRRIYIAGICVLTGLLYMQTADYGFALDDPYYYVENRRVQEGIRGIPGIFTEGSLDGYYQHESQRKAYGTAYRPLTLSTFALQYQLWGIHAKSGHLANILLAMINAVLLFSLIRRILPDWPIHFAGFTSLLFAAHPVHTEVVCNIKSRDELLAGFFVLMTLRTLLGKGAKHESSKYPVLPAALFACALLSKESSIAFLGAIPLLLYYTGIGGWKDHLRRVAPFLVVTAMYLLIRHLAVGISVSPSGERVLYNSLHAASNISELIGTKLSILLLFIKQGIFPSTLSYDYSFNQIPITTLLSAPALISLVLHLVMAFVIVRGLPKRDPVALGLLFYLLASVVTNNLFFSIGSTFAERFLYLPSAGLLIAMTAGLKQLNESRNLSPKNRKLIPAFALLILTAYSIHTAARIPVWADNSTLYASGLASAPHSARVHFDVGSDLLAKASASIDDGERIRFLEEAEAELSTSIRILPDYTEALYNLGVLGIQRGDTVVALNYYKRALESDSTHRPSLINTAFLHLVRAESDSSLTYLNHLMRIYPNDNDGLLNLSHLYYLAKDTLLARTYAEQGMRIYPEVAYHYRNMAAACALAGDTVGARKYMDQFLYRGGGK